MRQRIQFTQWGKGRKGAKQHISVGSASFAPSKLCVNERPPALRPRCYSGSLTSPARVASKID